MNPSTDISVAELHNHSGNEAFKSADFIAAYTNFSKAIKAADPKCAKYYTNRARTSLKLKRYNRAFDDAEAALKLDPINTKAYYCKGEALFGKCNYELAQKQFGKALELMPGDADIQLKIDECKKFQFDKSVQQKEMQKVAQANTSKELQAMWSEGRLPFTPPPGQIDVARMNREMDLIKATHPIVLEAHLNRDQENYSKAIRLYIKAADMGSAEAQYNLALMYMNGNGGPVDFTKSLLYLKKAASQPLFMAIGHPHVGVAEAHNSLGNHYREGLGVERDPSKAFEHYKISAEAGEAHGISNLGLSYERGEGTPKDILKAIEMYTQAAERNWPIAQYNLGVIYAEGYPGVVEKNITLAREWFSKSAANNHRTAAVALAELDGFSLSALQAAAETGAVEAMYKLGVAYEEGNDMLRPNVEQALEWFKKASNKKDPRALFRLGQLYLTKTSSSSDPQIKKAVKSIREAARLDHPQAQFLLSEFYLFGDYGCKRDLVEARSFRKQAIENGLIIPDTLQFDGDISDDDFNKLIRRVQKWEQSQGLDDTESISNKERLARYYKEFIDAKDELSKVTEQMSQLPNPRHASFFDGNEKYSLEKLAPYANTKVGRIMITAKNHHLRSFDFLFEGKIDRFVHEWFQAIKLCDIVCAVPAAIIELGPDILEKFISKNPHNAEAKFILANIYSFARRPLEIILPLLDDCVAINPQETTFHIFRGSMKCFANKFLDAIPDFDNALQILGPKDGYQVQYMRAAAKRMEKPYQQAALEDYRIYLDHAPPEDRKIPEAFYGMAMCYLAMKDMKKMTEFYNRGLEAEANRLPIFGPLDFEPKPMLASLVRMISASKYMNIPANKACPVCKESGKKLCGGCKKIWYCSKEHQKADWKEHKRICSNVSSQ